MHEFGRFSGRSWENLRIISEFGKVGNLRKFR
jgi:hypothetical protein